MIGLQRLSCSLANTPERLVTHFRCQIHSSFLIEPFEKSPGGGYQLLAFGKKHYAEQTDDRNAFLHG